MRTKQFQILFTANSNKYSLVGYQDSNGWWDFQLHSEWMPDGSLVCLSNHFTELPLIGTMAEVLETVENKILKYQVHLIYTVADAIAAKGE